MRHESVTTVIPASLNATQKSPETSHFLNSVTLMTLMTLFYPSVLNLGGTRRFGLFGFPGGQGTPKEPVPNGSRGLIA